MKFFRASDDPDAGDVHERWREARTLAGLNHPGLVAVYDVGTDQERWFFVMQLIEGQDLAARLAAGPLGLERNLTLGAALADGLAHVHRHGVVHGDVKPANVLLDAAGRPYLGDFGVATRPTREDAAGGAVHGTPSYLAPEHVTDRPVDTPADVYGLGLVLLECLTGIREYPVDAADPLVTANARLYRAPHVPEHLPSSVRDLLAAMTAFETTDRPRAAVVAAQLGALLAAATDAADTDPVAAPTGTARALAAACVAPPVLAGAGLAAGAGARARELAGIVHPYPSWADGPWNTALGELAEAMTRPLPARLARVALAARRSVPSRR